ncbi:MAG TPA: L-threonylcarbamoyladenylate synthase [Acidisarcina sp.]|nr:L-threonylcarbamoyladenylate synthase [Acidisarcina sp.]
MKTLRLAVDASDLHSELSQSSLQKAASILRGGGTVAFPTETVYGLGGNALDASAVTAIFVAKQRPRWDPLIVHVCDEAMLRRVAGSLPDAADRLRRSFWPGPLTLLVPRAGEIPALVTAGRERVGVRMPSHPVALELIRLAGVPIAAPSANSFGHTSPTTAQHVLDDLEGRIDAVLDSGEAIHGLESTVIDVCEDPPVIYRPGVVTLEQIRELCPGTTLFEPVAAAGEPESLPSPGVGLRHYAPHARLVLVGGTGQQQRQDFAAAVADADWRGERIGLMLPEGFSVDAGKMAVYRWGQWTNEEELARRLFAGLRQLDEAGVTVILCPLPEATGIGVAIRDRLQKAAK